MTRLPRGAPALALLLLLPAAGATAQRQVVIYRCTAPNGALTIQNDVPCPKGSRQQKQVIDVPPPMPAYEPRAARMPDVVAEEQQAAEAEVQAVVQAEVPPPEPDAPRAPPPPLFHCTTLDQESYYTEAETPQERCAPMRIVGLDGGAGAGSAAQACVTVPDRCSAVPADQLCEAWSRHVSEAQFRWKFGGADEDHAKETTYRTLAAELAKSNCGE